jgi:hypothetical protein
MAHLGTANMTHRALMCHQMGPGRAEQPKCPTILLPGKNQSTRSCKERERSLQPSPFTHELLLRFGSPMLVSWICVPCHPGAISHYNIRNVGLLSNIITTSVFSVLPLEQRFNDLFHIFPPLIILKTLTGPNYPCSGSFFTDSKRSSRRHSQILLCRHRRRRQRCRSRRHP